MEEAPEALTFARLIRRPGGYVPILLSLVALALVLGHVLMYGVRRGTDEGTAARLFQLLIAIQLPITAWVGWTWLPRAPKATATILVVQGLAILAALLPILVLEY